MHHPAPLVRQHEKHVQDLKTNRGHGEEVDGHQIFDNFSRILPPVLVFGLLFLLKTLVSPVFSPNRFLIGVAFGCAAGFFEEIGWTAFAFPAMRLRHSAIGAAISLGLLWGLWHAPVIDYLGSATPHGDYWLPFLLAFAAAMTAMTAMRALTCWIYSNTGSLLLAQLVHASAPGALATFSPVGSPRVRSSCATRCTPWSSGRLRWPS